MAIYRRSFRTRVRALFAAALFLLVVPGAAGAQSPATGEASSENVILSVSVAGHDVAVASDVAESESGPQMRAHASFVSGATADGQIGVAERTATNASEAGTDSATVGALSLDDLLELTLVEAGVDVDVADDAVRSSASGELADVDALNGLVTFDGVSTLSATEIDQDSSEASRSITLDGVSVLGVRSLLDQFGIDPYALACDAIETAGSTLDIQTSQACEELATAETAIDDATSALSTAASDLSAQTAGYTADEVESDKAAAVALTCGALDIACIANGLQDLVDLATTYSVTLSDPTDLDSSQAEIIAGLDELLVAIDDKAVVGDAVSEIADGTCDAADAAIQTIIDEISDEDPAQIGEEVAPLQSQIAEACDTLRDILDTLLDASVLSFDGVEISMQATAAAGASDSDVQVSIGSIRVGLTEATEIDAQDAEAAVEEIGPALEEFFAGLGLGFSAPELDLLVVENDHGQDGDEWYANASLTTVRLTVPSDSISVPDDAPLAILDNAGGVGAMHAGVFGVPAGALLAGVVSTPEAVVEAGVFSVGSTFTPASADAGNNDAPGADAGNENGEENGEATFGPAAGDAKAPVTLARTGVALMRTFALALLLLVVGAHVKRFAGQRP